MPSARGLGLSAAALAVALGAAACGGGGNGFGGGPDGASPKDAGSDAFEAAPPPFDAPNLLESGGKEGGPTGPSIVYAHTKDTLYQLDPKDDSLKAVGPFTGCTEVVDIALDKDSNMYATTLAGLYTVDTKTVKCTLVATGSGYPNSLSFVPAGTLDPMFEALVGYVGASYVRIDTKTGAMTTVGSIGQGYSSSGDIVSVKGGGTYLTVKGGPKGACNDCLVQVDPKTGAFQLLWGPVNRADVFGLAFWGGAVYGFDTAGSLFEIQFHGLAMQVTNLPEPGLPSGLSWFGAGSTTSAPLVPVK